MTAIPVQTREYIKARAENHLLVENKDFGHRKYINIPMNRQFSKSKNAGGSKSWVHPPEALLRGHIVYNCKFLGNVEVEDSKGTEIVKDAIRKMKFYGHTEVDEPKGSAVVKDAITKLKFNKQIKRAEGQKPPKVELTVSVDGVTVQEPKYKVMQHRFPLHRISYCADDKSDKRIFTFIAKEADSNKHHCFVFDSEKCAEEITLTIGQAFDLAYKKFLESSRGDMNQRKQDLLLQKKVLTKAEQVLGAGYDQSEKRQSGQLNMNDYGYDQTATSMKPRGIHSPSDGSLAFVDVQTLTQENLHLKARVADLERLINPKVLEELDRNRTNQETSSALISVAQQTENQSLKPTSPKNPFASPKGMTTKPEEVPVVGRRLENLVFDEQNQSNKPQTNGTSGVPVLAPPPPIPARSSLGQHAGTPPSGQQRGQVDLFGAPPFNPSAVASPTGAPPAAANSPTQKPVTSPSNPFAAADAFGMPVFNPSTATPAELDQQIQKVDKELLDLQTGFSQGLSFGDDFNLDDLDPLKQ